ncbi:uncharacterized protein LOC131665570 [Phymastichus coffea]|uniref:uncharacterized protein LOC131665570 n=1 Tax=Phymastichus coffea TaxID=108790 RepID=UPI00273B062D|nr:uncharacterized protein LOC131665570 [Phymastichus coffea]
MQTIKVENVDPSKTVAPEKKAQNREKQLLTFVVKATARDQEKNILISKLQREISEAVENLEALQAEVTLKDKILRAKDDELLTIKSENEALNQKLQLLLSDNKTPFKSGNNNFGLKKNDNNVFKTSLKLINNVALKNNDKDVVKIKNNKSPGNNNHLPSMIPTPDISRKRSFKKSNMPKDNMTNLFYNLRKKSKK